jgi:cytochrome c oxidase assembly factor 1
MPLRTPPSLFRPILHPSSQVRPQRRLPQNLKSFSTRPPRQSPTSTFTHAPPRNQILTERLPNRDLPPATPNRSYLLHIPLFLVLVSISAAAIFNYQKQSSPVVNAVLYALRRNEKAREILGEEIYFESRIPWIRGELNQLHGRVDLGWWVAGVKKRGPGKDEVLERGRGYVRIVSRREGGKMGSVSF